MSRRRSFNPQLEKLRQEGQARATKVAQQRVAGAVHLQMKAGVPAFEAAVKAIAAETGRPMDEVAAWLSKQREKFLKTKEKLEKQFLEQEAAKS